MKSFVTTVHYSFFFCTKRMGAHSPRPKVGGGGGGTCHWSSIDCVVSIKNSKQISDLNFSFPNHCAPRETINDATFASYALFVAVTQGEELIHRCSLLRFNKSEQDASWSKYCCGGVSQKPPLGSRQCVHVTSSSQCFPESRVRRDIVGMEIFFRKS